MSYPEYITKPVEALMNELEKYFPDVRTKKYEKGNSYWVFSERMELGLFLELIFSGYITYEKCDQIHK